MYIYGSLEKTKATGIAGPVVLSWYCQSKQGEIDGSVDQPRSPQIQAGHKKFWEIRRCLPVWPVLFLLWDQGMLDGQAGIRQSTWALRTRVSAYAAGGHWPKEDARSGFPARAPNRPDTAMRRPEESSWTVQTFTFCWISRGRGVVYPSSWKQPGRRSSAALAGMVGERKNQGERHRAKANKKKQQQHVQLYASNLPPSCGKHTETGLYSDRSSGSNGTKVTNGRKRFCFRQGGETEVKHGPLDSGQARPVQGPREGRDRDKAGAVRLGRERKLELKCGRMGVRFGVEAEMVKRMGWLGRRDGERAQVSVKEAE
jgi:hypothetical protein